MVNRARREALCALCWVTGLVALTSCDKADLGDPSATLPIDRFSISSHSIPADGATLTTVSAYLPAEAQNDRRQITFSTSGGAFVVGASTSSSITVSVASEGRAIALLRSPTDSGLAFVRASAGSGSLADSVTFVRALPDRLDVEPVSLAAKADPSQPISVTVTLRRSIGIVTKGTPVQIIATRVDGGDAGRFVGAPISGENGIVNFKYTPGSIPYRGQVTITATASGINGGTVRGSAIVDVIAP